MSLHRFESFVPKKLDVRQERMRLIKEKELKELKELSIKLSNVVSTFKDLKIDNEVESFFIDMFIDCQIKFDYEAYPNIIFFFDKNDKHLAEYDLKEEEFWINDKNILSILELKYALHHYEFDILITTCVEKYFKLKDFIVEWYKFDGGSSVEEHFKLIPAINI